MSETKKAPSGKEVVFKTSITRKEDREIKNILFDGIKSTKTGAMDQTSVVQNIEKQKDMIVKFYVETYAGKAMDDKVLDDMKKDDYEFCYKEARNVYDEIEKKKV